MFASNCLKHQLQTFELGSEDSIESELGGSHLEMAGIHHLCQAKIIKE